MAIQKNANLDISVAAEQNQNYNAKPSVQFSTQDRNTAKYTFTVKQNNKTVDLTGVTATVTLYMADKSVFQNNATVTNAKEGEVEYTIPPDAIRHHGLAKGELKLTYANGDALGGLRFSFTIEQSLIDKADGVLKEVYIEDFQAISNAVNKKAEEVTINLERLDEEYQNKAYTVDEKLADVQATVNDLRENGTGIDAQARQEVEQVTEQLEGKLNKGVLFVNVKDFKCNDGKYVHGDGSHDDTTGIQAALDYVYKRGGGTVFFPLGHYKTTLPLLAKSVAANGGYNFSPVILKGEGNSSCSIIKEGTNQLHSLDATIILIRGSSLNINDSVSAVQFDNIRIKNNSTHSLTYGVYMNKGSRILSSYSSFETIKDYSTIENHNRYAFFTSDQWSCTFRDCMFIGDYGLYMDKAGTSLILENAFASTDKIAYRIVGVYSTIINSYGDFCKGTMFQFSFADVNVTTISAESSECMTMIDAQNSTITINHAFFNQSVHDKGRTIFLHNTTLKIRRLKMVMQAGDPIGYLWEGGTNNRLEIDKLTLAGSGNKFKYNSFSTMGANFYQVRIPEDKSKAIKGVSTLNEYSDTGYWDWYTVNPQYPINSIHLGLKTPITASNGENIEWSPGAKKNDIYFNTNFKENPYLGWVRYDQTSETMRNGSNWYIPLILSGTTAQRPTSKVKGMSYFDETINKPIWWNGANWVDANGTTV